VAVTAAVFLNLALVASFVWSELISTDARSALWVVLAAAWLASAVYSEVSSRRAAAGQPNDPPGDLFAEATEQYLKGDYFQAERALVSLVRDDARDLDARLMLATLMRHTGRLEEAAGQLDLLVRLEGAGKWEFEINQERERLAEAAADPADETEQSQSGQSGEPPAPRMHAA